MWNLAHLMAEMMVNTMVLLCVVISKLFATQIAFFFGRYLFDIVYSLRQIVVAHEHYYVTTAMVSSQSQYDPSPWNIASNTAKSSA